MCPSKSHLDRKYILLPLEKMIGSRCPLAKSVCATKHELQSAGTQLSITTPSRRVFTVVHPRIFRAYPFISQPRMSCTLVFPLAVTGIALDETCTTCV